MSLDNKTILRIQQVETKSGYKRPTIYKKIKAGEFPKQISLGARAVGWLESEIDEWIEERISEREAVK